KAKLLQVPLYSIDVKVDHHFLESTIGALEAKIEVLSLDPCLAGLCGHERAFEQPTLFKIAQDHFRVCLIRNLGLVVERSVVQSHDRIRIEDAAFAVDEPEQVLFLDDLARFSVKIHFPFSRPP